MNKIFVLTILTLLSLSFSHSVLAAELPAKYTNEIGMTFVLIPPGIYQMRSYHRGDTPSASWHWVRFNKPFYLQTTEVTQQQWEKVMFQAGVDTLNETQNKLVNRYTSFYNNDYESTYIEDKLSDEILEGKIKEGDHVIINIENEMCTFTKK